MRVLALDVGTSSVRAAAYDERGEADEATVAQTRYEPTEGHDGSAEFDPDHLVEVAAGALEQVRRRGGPFDALAVSCFWHSLLGVDERGRAATPLYTWRDTRAAPQAERLAGALDAEAVHARTGCVLHPSYWPAKLLWLAEREPERARASARFLSFSDYLFLRLAGDGRTSLSMASGTGLLDLRRRGWDEEVLAAVGVDAARLPELSEEPAAGPEPWFRAAGDGACSNVGAGCVQSDRAALMIGTSGALRVVCPGEREPRRGLFRYLVDADRAVEGGALSDGGNLYAWLEKTLARAGTAGLAERPPDGHGLTFLALLGGERSPGWRARARGAIAGLSFDTTVEDILQAALEGVALRFAEVADLLPEVREVVATGHALLADADWAQICADVLERPLVLSGVAEGSARGAAVLALERLGARPDPAALGRVFEPRPERAAAYRLARERQRNLYREVA